MPDREKVIKALNDALTAKKNYRLKSARMSFEFIEMLIALLKEQEAVKPKSKTRHGATTMVQHWCGNCMVMLHGKPKYCPNCGRSVKWE